MVAKPDRRSMTKRKGGRSFDVRAFLAAHGVRELIKFDKNDVLYSQGTDCDGLLYVIAGRVKLSVLSRSGKEAVVAMLEPNDFFGEGCLAGQPLRMSSATATSAGEALVITKPKMIDLLQTEQAFSERFLAHMLARNIRIEADLVAQLFNGTEKRLARALLLLARYGKEGPVSTPVPAISQQTLADMVGTSRSRVNFFMNKFRRLGFIDYKDGITVNQSLLTVVLHD